MLFLLYAAIRDRFLVIEPFVYLWPFDLFFGEAAFDWILFLCFRYRRGRSAGALLCSALACSSLFLSLCSRSSAFTDWFGKADRSYMWTQRSGADSSHIPPLFFFMALAEDRGWRKMPLAMDRAHIRCAFFHSHDTTFFAIVIVYLFLSNRSNRLFVFRERHDCACFYFFRKEPIRKNESIGLTLRYFYRVISIILFFYFVLAFVFK